MSSVVSTFRATFQYRRLSGLAGEPRRWAQKEAWDPIPEAGPGEFHTPVGWLPRPLEGP